MLTRYVSCGVVCLLAIAAVADAQTSSAAVAVAEPTAATATVGIPTVPVEVRLVEVTAAGAQATLVNATPHVLVMYEAALQRADGTAVSMTGASGLEWQPGSELVVMLPARPVPDDAAVVVRAALGARGEEYGDRTLLRRHRDRAQARLASLAAVVAVLDEAGVPASEQALQDLVDHLALAMARAPREAANESGLSAFVAPLVALKQLQGRELAGTERLGREIAALRERLVRESAATR